MNSVTCYDTYGNRPAMAETNCTGKRAGRAETFMTDDGPPQQLHEHDVLMAKDQPHLLEPEHC